MHRKRNPHTGPAVWLAAMLTLYSAVVFATVWLATTGWGQVEQVGFILGALATAFVTREVWRAVLGFGTRPTRMVENLAAQRERMLNTGTWRRLGCAPALRVRHDPRTGEWFIRGRLAAGWDFPEEVLWLEPTRLFQAVLDAEATGLRPEGDEGTRVVRARLDLPNWRDPYAANDCLAVSWPRELVNDRPPLRMFGTNADNKMSSVRCTS
jgi:hypothetical protein